jgi:hypothetical protein
MRNFAPFRILLLASAACLTLPAAAWTQVDEPPETLAKEYEALTRDIEVMRRVLEKALRAHLAPPPAADAEGSAETGLAGESWTVGGTSPDAISFVWGPGTILRGLRSQGFFVPGTGAMFVLEVPVPMREIDAQGMEKPPANLWEETEKEIGRGALVRTSRKEAPVVRVLDSEAVDGVIDRLLATVSSYGGNIENLRPSERVILFVTFVGSGRTASGEDAAKLLSEIYGASGRRPTEDVVLQIPVESIRPDVDPVTLRRECRIDRFPRPGESWFGDRGVLLGR